MKYYIKTPKDLDKYVTPNVSKYNQEFCACIDHIKKRHDPLVKTVAQGVLELKDHWKKTNSPLLNNKENSKNGGIPLPLSVQTFLDRFYLSRIGIRVLLGQHITLSHAASGKVKPPADYVGIICTKTRLKDVVNSAVEDARILCKDYFGLWESPKVKILGKEDISFRYIPRIIMS
jgi:pyruvate dehydrogenase kinase 2/3/4